MQNVKVIDYKVVTRPDKGPFSTHEHPIQTLYRISDITASCTVCFYRLLHLVMKL